MKKMLSVLALSVLVAGAAAVVAGNSVAEDAALKPAFDKARLAPVGETTAPRARKIASRSAQAASASVASEPASKSAWRSRCASATRQVVPECVVEQTAILGKTGQMLASVSIHVPPTGGQPVMMVHVPVGLFLPAGISIRIDQQAPLQLVIQTCDLQGCYAGSPVSAGLLNAMKAGKQLTVEFKNLSKQSIMVPLTLTQFAETYRSIQ